MRDRPTVLHLDLDAFFAAVEQRDKPSLRGKPVVVGGIGGRGVVATASYEARAYGVHSAMPTWEARSRCPHAAFLTGRFEAYRAASEIVMGVLAELSPLVQPLSLDEAFVDLDAGGHAGLDTQGVTELGAQIKDQVHEATGGLTASIGAGTSKLIAKIASDLGKPDGLLVVPPGTERELIGPMQVSVIQGIGPATAQRLRRAGLQTVDQVADASLDELVQLLGQAGGTSLHHLARAQDDRPVVADREAKSVSAEDTFATDLTGPRVLEGVLDRQARRVAERLEKHHLSGRTVTIKVRLADFTTFNRSATLAGPTDDPRVISRTARTLLESVDTIGGVRLLGVGVSGLSDWVQDALDLGLDTAEDPDSPPAERELPPSRDDRSYRPGNDVIHDDHGRGWVWGSGSGRVTVRFETAETGPGPVRTFAIEDPALRHWRNPRSDPDEPGTIDPQPDPPAGT